MRTLFGKREMHAAHPEQRRKHVAAFAGGLALMLLQGAAMAGIFTTRHNLSSSGSFNKFDGTAEICVFCHTPHGANSAITAPLWNRNLSTAAYASYASLGTSSLDGQTIATGSVSIACLSCHDGSQAMNIMVNTPGSGTTGTLAGNWSGSGQFGVGTLASTFTYIGTDLTNDHPIGIQYAGGGIALNTSKLITNDPYFAQASGNGTPLARSGSVIGQVGTKITGSGKTVWWVETNGVSGQQQDDLSLYTRTDATLTDPQPFVECASCHDPHSSNTTFLRISNNSSALCLTCHVK